jgi:membrane protein implicated in regulation of membrane protease activity
MGEWILSLFGNSIALLTFFSIFAAGMTFTVFQLLFGGDHDADHGDFHGELGGDHDGDLDGDHDADGGDGHGPGLLSIRGATFLLTGFGGIAFITMYFTDKVFVSSLVGVFGGWPFALVCLAMYRVFIRQEASSLVKEADFVGATGTVVTSIPEDGLGEVTLLVAGQQLTKSAIADGGGAVKTGTQVRVTRYHGDRVSVQRLES